MQNTEHVEETPSESEGLIKTPRQLIVTVILAFLIPIIGIFMLVKLVAVTSPMGAGSKAQSSEAIAERIQPVAGFKLVDASAPTESKTGEQVYESTCAACHSSGVAGAPKTGDDAAWAPLIETGFDEMLKIAIDGVGAMPPRGGNASLSDLEVARAVTYMANQSGASFDEPTEPSSTPADSVETQQTAEKPVEVDDAAQQPTQEQDEPEVATDETQPAVAAAPDSDQAQAGATEAELDPAGEKLYKAVCFTCHTSGVANAPKLGDKADWAPYIETGFDAMLEKSIHGVGAMPPRGGSQASDDEMKAALEFMLSKVQ